MPNVSTEYQTALARELRPLSRRILRALAERPDPGGREAYVFDVEMLATGLPDALTPPLEALAESIPALLDERPWLPPDEAAREAVAQVEGGVDSLLEALESVWERPFPYGLEDGQRVFSAVVERPLKDVLAAVEWLLARFEDEDDEAAAYEVSFDLTQEAEAVSAWMRRQGWGEGSGGCSWTSLAAAFLLGRWLGRT
jgi:hypothetical protein